MSQSCDIAIIGAGPSGAVAAALLLKHGFSVCVLEKQHFPASSLDLLRKYSSHRINQSCNQICP